MTLAPSPNGEQRFQDFARGFTFACWLLLPFLVYPRWAGPPGRVQVLGYFVVAAVFLFLDQLVFRKSIGEAECGASSSVEQFRDSACAPVESLEELVETVEALRRSLDALAEPTEDELALHWRDASTTTARLRMRFDEGGRSPKVHVNIKVQTRDQQPSFPLFVEKEGRVLGGAVPIFWAHSQWPQWFPMCHSAQLLASWGPNRKLWLLTYKIGIISVELVAFFCLLDRLDHEGSLDVLMRSPPPAIRADGRRAPPVEKRGEGEMTWLGVHIPPCRGQFRIRYDMMRLALEPHGQDHGEARFQCSMTFVPGTHKFYVLFWKTVANWVLPLIAKMQTRFEGSPLDTLYNGSSPESIELRTLMAGLHAHLLQTVSKAPQELG